MLHDTDATMLLLPGPPLTDCNTGIPAQLHDAPQHYTTTQPQQFTDIDLLLTWLQHSHTTLSAWHQLGSVLQPFAWKYVAVGKISLAKLYLLLSDLRRVQCPRIKLQNIILLILHIKVTYLSSIMSKTWKTKTNIWCLVTYEK